MEVINRGIDMQSKYKVMDVPPSIKEGDISLVTIKERMADNEAKVTLKGQLVSVKFEGSIPNQDRVMVEVTNKSENGKMMVKPISTTSSSSKIVDQLLEKAGFDPSAHIELREAVKQILLRGGSVSEDSLNDLQDFLKNDKGNLLEKLETIKVMQQKNIEFTKVQLHAVNTALQENILSEPLLELLDSPIGNLEEYQKSNSGSELLNTLKKSVFTNLKEIAGLTDVNEAIPQDSAPANISEILQEKSTPSDNNAVQDGLKFERNQSEKLGWTLQNSITEEDPLTSVSHLNAKKELDPFNGGEEGVPRLSKTNVESSLTMTEQYLINEVIQTIPIDSKNIVVTEITKKLGQLAIDFKKYRQEMSQNLVTATKLLETKNTAPAKQVLEGIINKLDKAILKGDFMLYADMNTEKELLVSSSRLAEARNLLTKGNYDEANQIVKQVKEGLEKLIFKPSDNVVKHFTLDEELVTPKQILENALQPLNDQDPKARKIFETVRSLGLTHEADSTQVFAKQQENQHNLKSLFLQMLDSEDGQSKLIQPLENALANITGQQLLSKQDSSGAQSMLLQLPILLNKEVESVRIFVNSQKQSDKIDWENCSLYFVLETRKLGEIGIHISSVNRNLSITFKSNQKSLQEAVKPLTKDTKDRLHEIGYNVSTIQFKSLSAKAVAKKDAAEKPSKPKMKGFDFSV